MASSGEIISLSNKRGAVMNWDLILGIALLVYSLICFYVAFAKPEWIWKTGKVRLFVKTLGDKGTVILIVVFGFIALVIGLLTLFI